MQMEWGYIGTVVVSGLLIVFVALWLLIIAVSVMGKIMEAADAKKKKAAAPADVKREMPSPAAEPVTRDIPAPSYTDDTEVVAVIAAAVAAISEETGRKLRITGIRPAAVQGRSAWGAAAMADSMRSI